MVSSRKLDAGDNTLPNDSKAALDDADVVVLVPHLFGVANDQQEQAEDLQPNPPDRVIPSAVSCQSKDEQALRGEENLEKDVSSHGPSSLHSTTGTNPQIHEQEQPQIPLSMESFTHDDLQHSRSNPTFNLLPPILSSATSSPSSIVSHGSSMEPGVDSFRRFIRSRATARTRTTAESSSQRSTQSLGDEDMFAYAADESIPSGSDHAQPPQRRASWDVASMQQPGESVPPIVWEESSDSDRGERRRAAEPAPHNNNSNNGGSRLRGFLPAVRRRGGRQSSSVRRHLPGSSSSSAGTSMVLASPLSTTAAAVLFTSSQASNDSINEYALSPHRRGIATQAREPSASTLDDSAMAAGASTHRSTAVDVGGIDALSISTVGNSTMARSEPAGLGDSGRQSYSTSRNDVLSLQQRTQNRAPPPSGRGEHGTADPNQADPHREARIRWIRINRRFQLMTTCMAILFSLVLFSILVGWIVLTSAYVVTFGRDCDVPLKFFYWMATLQLVLDVFRGDIMRYVLRWNPAQHPAMPNRVVSYNIAYLAFAMLVLRLGVECVYVNGQEPNSTCRITSPELFQASLVFVTLILAAWSTIIFGYLVPFCVVATILTWNGYNPSDDQNNASNAGGVFSSTYGNINGAPPGTVEQMRDVDFDECRDNCPQECCICMEDFCAEEAIVITDCGHILHKDCMSVWLRQARTCPVCRTDIPNAQAERDPETDDTEHRQNLSDNPPPSDRDQQRHLRLPSPVPPVPVPLHQRVPVTHMPFRPAGRREVAILMRAFRQPPRRDQGSATGSRRRGSQGSRSRSNLGPSEKSMRSSHTDQVENAPAGHDSSVEIGSLHQPVSQPNALNGQATEV